MKKLSLLLIVTALLASHSAAHADWSTELQTAISSGNYAEINVIAANNPNEQGAIALALLNAAQGDISSNPNAAIKLFAAAAPFGDQIPTADAKNADTIIAEMLALATNPELQKKDPHGASSVFVAALALSSDPNLLGAAPNLHNIVLADADDFKGNNPDGSDQDLDKEISLALQVGSPPLLGPHGFLTPSPE